MSKIEIYEDCVKINQLEYLLPYIIITAIITLIASFFMAAVIVEQHKQEPTKEGCIEYFNSHTK